MRFFGNSATISVRSLISQQKVGQTFQEVRAYVESDDAGNVQRSSFGFSVAVDEQDGRCAWVVPACADCERLVFEGGLRVARTGMARCISFKRSQVGNGRYHVILHQTGVWSRKRI